MSIAERIQQLKKERNAVILAHNYQIPAVQDIADFVGDSLGLSIQASKTDAEVIVFCGVHFMAETAKILSPEKTVLLPEKAAGCLMADMIDADQLRALKAEHPGAKVLCYVNTSAAVKAECDLCCTSANAVRMVREGLREAAEIIFVPDKYLADYVSAQTGRSFIVWPGFCPTHARILPENVREEKVLHPEAVVIAHPECPPELRQLADCVTSTEGMCRYVRESTAREIIVATERGILHRLRKENPGKIFYPASRFALCMNMKLIQQEKILWALEDMGHEIVVPPEVAEKARAGIQRMLDFSE
ncbi:MAG TPA: quinolinate synthase NadA [Syntrophales bacterium]|nr:quinolinate synthase NadA [Syntrophales bacterium]HOD98336.1 quinolinate synthase NadA [Syntrophales bacterium]HOH73213.1 quinolinate synthase NadA [Syntrophales bacterium]HPN08755.1 quinolinate synthase NadA [Syntrophales bacterium]HPX80339.1 quinolinate synthase NadA [Syntrophales bacterium]